MSAVQEIHNYLRKIMRKLYFSKVNVSLKYQTCVERVENISLYEVCGEIDLQYRIAKSIITCFLRLQFSSTKKPDNENPVQSIYQLVTCSDIRNWIVYKS